MSEWIKCSERMPSESSHQRMALWNGSYIRIGKWLSQDCSGENCRWYDDWDEKIRGRKIIAWMPLPEPPED